MTAIRSVIIVALLASPGSAGASAARQSTRYLAGRTVTGVVLGRDRIGSIAFLAFGAESRAPGTVRMVSVTCSRDGSCATVDETFAGEIVRAASGVTLSGRSVALGGDVRLSGTVTDESLAGSWSCRAAWGARDGDDVSVRYDANGSGGRVAWTGTVAGRRVWSPPGLGCGLFQLPGVVAMS